MGSYSLNEKLTRIASAWLAADPDPITRATTQDLIDRQDPVQLKRFFADRLQFGTAGLRGPLGPGPGGMNRLMVQRVTRGLARYGCQQAGGHPTAVVGYDGRHGSQQFAADTAIVFADQGYKVWLFDGLVPTPLLASAVLALHADLGVMITASHNPPADNGYKVYWSNGAQIISPHDREISASIDRYFEEPFELSRLSTLRDCDKVLRVPDWVASAYLQSVLKLRVHTGNSLRIAYTPLHGVGFDLLKRVFQAAAHHDLQVVEAQAEPDGDFPTLSFPNPEEPGAMALTLQLAQRIKADLVLANDPDADRLAVGVPDGQGGYRMLTGDQVGILLADDLLAHRQDANQCMVATTLVSSSMLKQLARHYGAHYEETLTGFKWIANCAIEFERDGGRFVLGYEEALGYCVGSAVRDKDGISAALIMADLAAWCRSRSTTVLAQLEQLYRQHGFYASCQKNIVLSGANGVAKIDEMMQRLRAARPGQLAGNTVLQIRDVLNGAIYRPDSLSPGAKPQLASSNVLIFDLDNGGRVIARPSGTEPKLKFYIEVQEPLETADSMQQSQLRANQRMDELAKAIMALAGAQ